MSDLRVAMLLLIIGRVTADPDKLISGNNFFTQLFADADPRVRHYASCLVLHRLMSQPDSRERCVYWVWVGWWVGMCVDVCVVDACCGWSSFVCGVQLYSYTQVSHAVRIPCENCMPS